MLDRKTKRGAYGRDECVFIGAWIPRSWVPRINALIAREDSDRSKVIRKALEHKLQEVA